MSPVVQSSSPVHCTVNLVPRPPPFFVLQFVFSTKHGSRRAAKNGEGLGTLITWMTSGGHAVDVGGKGATAKTMHCIICLSALPQFWTPDISAAETTCLDW